MPMEDTAKQNTGAPAWPTLLGVQALIIGALGWMFVGASTEREIRLSELERRLVALDVPHATAAVNGELEKAENPTALKDADVLRVTSFLALAGTGAGLQVDDIQVEVVPGAQSDSEVEVVEAIIDIRGDLYDLPIFVDGAHRQRAVGALQSLSFDVKPGGAAQGRVRFRYYRPNFSDTDWIGLRLATAAPGAAAATDVLISASELQNWRAFNERSGDRNSHAMAARARAARELPPNLVDLRASGGRFVWDADAGIAIR
jgi:hypothetical protein